MRFCAQGKIDALVRHLAVTELQIEKGPTRQSLLRAAAATAAATAARGFRPALEADREKMRSERQRISKEWRYAEPLAEQVILGLYLDGQLSWPRIRPPWQKAAPPTPPGAVPGTAKGPEQGPAEQPAKTPSEGLPGSPAKASPIEPLPPRGSDAAPDTEQRS